MNERVFLLPINSNHRIKMIEYHFDAGDSILHIQPRSALQKEDFEMLASAVDPIIAEKGDLAGLIIETPTFPGWDSLGAMIAHLKFARDHHRHIRKVAIVTDSALGMVAENVASHFVAAEIKQFPANGIEAAKAWMLERA